MPENVFDTEGSDDDSAPEGAESPEAVTQRLAKLRSALSSFAPPSVPLAEPWELSLVAVIRSLVRVPKVVAKLLGVLDRFGAIRLSSESVGFDNDDVAWDRITTIRTRPLGDLLTESALEREVDRLGKLVPRAPGRKWLIERCREVIQTLAETAIDKVGRESMTNPVVAEVEYKGALGRKRTMTGGMVVAGVLGAISQVNEALLSTAKTRGVRVEAM